MYTILNSAKHLNWPYLREFSEEKCIHRELQHAAPSQQEAGAAAHPPAVCHAAASQMKARTNQDVE